MEVGDPLIKNNQQLLNRIHVVLDAVVMVIAYMLAWFFRFRSGFFALDAWYLSLQAYMPCTHFCGAGISDLILCISAIYSETCAGKKTGSLACSTGQCNGYRMFYYDPVSAPSDRLFQKDAVCVLMY